MSEISPPRQSERPDVSALAIDTTSEVLSVGVLTNGHPIETVYETLGKEMNKVIIQRIDHLLAEAGLSPASLDFLVAARGPGSFTGTRIGLAVAQTFAHVHNLPLLGIDTLTLLASQVSPNHQGRFHALLNAARDEVFHRAFEMQAGAPVPLGEITLTRFRDLEEKMSRGYGKEYGREYRAGEPVILRRFPPLKENPEINTLNLLTPLHPHPNAERLLLLGLKCFQRGETPSAAPIYLKSEAFRKWKP